MPIEQREAITSDPLNYESRRIEFERHGFLLRLITREEARRLWREFRGRERDEDRDEEP